jgi:glucose-1-phosphate thymidylyltransferase
MHAGMREILIISTPQDTPRFAELLGDGSRWGLSLSYCVQPGPDGLAQAFILGRSFVQQRPSALVLGDNSCYGHDLPKLLHDACSAPMGATVFACHVQDPEHYSVVELDARHRVISNDGEPRSPRRDCAVTGLYFYDEQACDIAATLKPSARGELEIADLNARYLREARINVKMLGRGCAWLDTGTHDSLLESQPVCRHSRAAPGSEGRLSRRGCDSLGLDRGGAAGTPGRPLAEERLRKVPDEAF